MLGAIAAVALVVGSLSATAVVTEDQRLSAEDTRAAVVEVQAVETMPIRLTPKAVHRRSRHHCDTTGGAL